MAGVLRFLHEQPAPRVLAMYQESNAREFRDNLFQQLEPFSAQLRGLQGETRMLPPGRARLSTNPVPIGSDTPAMMMGIVFVEFFAALIAGVETATIRSTLERTSSLAISGRRSSFSSAYRYSMVMRSPFDVAQFPQTFLESSLACWQGSPARR